LKLTFETTIDATPDVVWDHVVGLERWPDVMNAITKVEVLTNGPIGVGTTFRETRVMFGREESQEMTISEFHEPSRLAFDAEAHGCKYHTQKRFEPIGSGQTRLVMEFGAEPQTLVAKILGAITGPLAKGSVCKGIEGDLADIKAACEGRSGDHGDG